MDGNIHVVRIVEGGGRAVESRIIECPGGRCPPRDEVCKLVRVRGSAEPTPLGGEVELIPTGDFRDRR